MKQTEQTIKEQERAYLVGVVFNTKQNIEAESEELIRLCETAKLVVVGQTYQHIKEITPATLIGSGKVEEIKAEVEKLNVDVVVVDEQLTGSQQKNLCDALDVKVIDRLGLILDIFASRATSQEGKLQVELAQLKYTLPRLSSFSGTSGRFGSGGVGTRGPGETKLETSRRKIEDKILKLEKDIKNLENQRELKRKNRYQSNKKQVAIVGYTNAGKSTLLNLISKAGIYADDKLFATLDTTSRSVFLSPECQIILTDTVGFINKLPHSLIDAFASTLEEAKLADLIIHVVDISNKDYKEQMQTVNETLVNIGADKITQIIAYNKVDKIPATPFIKLKDNEILISAKSNQNITLLKDLIIKYLTN